LIKSNDEDVMIWVKDGDFLYANIAHRLKLACHKNITVIKCKLDRV